VNLPAVQWHPEPDPNALVRRVTASFTAAFGDAAEGVWAAPGRVNLIGEHVDYNQGVCLPLALEHRTFVAAKRRADGVVRLRSAQVPGAWIGALDEIGPGLSPGWAGYALGVLSVLRRDDFTVPGLDLYVDSEVPVGAGLSSSAALECAVVVAVDDLAGLGLAVGDEGRRRLADICVRAENEVVGAPTGGMDQAAALRSRAATGLVLDCADNSIERVPLDFQASGLALLVTDTRSQHAHVDGEYGSRRAACQRAAGLLGVDSLREISIDDLAANLDRLPDAMLRRRVSHVVTEIDRVQAAASLLRAGKVVDTATLLDESHRSLSLDFEVSSEELDLACRAARDAGALGARMTGGGFGGSTIALVPVERVREVSTAVASAFRSAKFRDPAFLLARAGGPAERVAGGTAG
jgi:galactokinase